MSNEQFTSWLNDILEEELPEGMAAINFNIYDDGDNYWAIELVGTNSFDENDEDWACDEAFTTRETPFEWEEKCTEVEILAEVEEAIKGYLNGGMYAEKLKAYTGVGAGFVDGDLVIVHKK